MGIQPLGTDFKVWFYTFLFMILYMYIALGQVLTTTGEEILMSTERPYHFTYLLFDIAFVASF